MKQVSILNAEYYSWGERCDGWHLVKRGDLSIIQERIPAGSGEVMHYHTASRQVFYVLEGIAEMRFAAEIVVLHEGDSLEVPPKVPHRIRNNSSEDLGILVISMPPSHRDRVDCDPASTG